MNITNYMPFFGMAAIILIVILVSIEYTLGAILRELRAIRNGMGYTGDHMYRREDDLSDRRDR